MCLLFHDWDKWQEYTVNAPERRLTDNWALCALTEYRQKRTCKSCGFTQDEFIRSENRERDYSDFDRMRAAQMLGTGGFGPVR